MRDTLWGTQEFRKGKLARAHLRLIKVYRVLTLAVEPTIKRGYLPNVFLLRCGEGGPANISEEA
jgi:hypothetical protein